MDRWFLTRVCRAFMKDEAFMHAESIAFCALLAIIPLAMLMISAAGFVLGSFDDVFNQLVEGISDLIPWGKDLFLANIQSIMEKRSHLGMYGIVTLIFIASFLVSSIEVVFDKIFRTEKSRNFFHSRLVGVGMIFLVTLLMFFPTLAGLMQMSLARFGLYVPLAAFMTGKVYYFVVVFTAYLMIVVMIPNKKVYLRYAVVGAVIFSAGIGIMKYVFQWYLQFAMNRYDIIYGSLSAVILTVVWIYYLSVVLLFSAEIVSELQHRRMGVGGAGREAK